MKTETQIAEENIDNVQRVLKEEISITELHYKGISAFHKETCQRFLDYLTFFLACNISKRLIDKVQNQITDLKNAIKKYVEAGI